MTTAADRKAVRDMAKRYEIIELQTRVRIWKEEVDAMKQRNDIGESYILDHAKRQLHKAQRALVEAQS